MMPFVYQCQPYPSYTCNALPSPPLSYPSKMPQLTNLSHSFTTLNTMQPRDINSTSIPPLPSIHHLVLPSPSPSNNSIAFPDSSSLSPTSSSTSLYFPRDLSLSPLERRLQNGSIQSLLNSAPELKQLDEEEHKCGYQSHFVNPGVKRKKSHPYPPPASFTKRSRLSSKRYDTISSYTSTIMASPSSTKGGLRHFSKQVCDKVKAHGITTYDQVVHEITCDLASSSSAALWFDQKNIRRRVYDALNVLMAMDIIAKVKKEIKWLGIPSCYKHDAMCDTDKGGNMDLLLDTGDSFLVQQIQAEEERKKMLLSSLSEERLHIRKSLRKYLQLRRLIYRNQQSNRKLPFMMNGNGLDHHINKSFPPYSSVDIDVDLLARQFDQPFTTQELSAWVPDSSWYHFIDLNAS